MAADDAGQPRIEELERKLADALRRIEALEGARPAETRSEPAARSPQPAVERRSIPPPPVISAPPRPVTPPRRDVPAMTQAVVAPVSNPLPTPIVKPAPAKSTSRLEYDLGAKVMPWAGSIIVIIGLGFLIGNGIERGWFTPWMQFSLAMLISLTFMGVGFWKRSTREDFGGILIGIGSCGVFLSIAGGQIFHHLYSKEMLVGSFFGWGLVNLGYSSFIKSRAFLVIGLLGGLGASLMPLAEQNVPVNFALHFAVVIPAMVIAMRHRWSVLVTAFWWISSICLLPGIASEADWMLRSGAFALNALVAAIAYCRSFEEPDFDRPGVFAAVMAGAAGLAAIFSRNDVLGSASVAVIALVFGAAAYLHRDSKAGRMLGLGAALTAVLLIPLGFRGFAPSLVYAVFAVICTAISIRGKSVTPVVLGGIACGGAILMYMIGAQMGPILPWQEDIGLLLLICAAAGFSAWAANRVRPGEESWTFAACVVALPLMSRMAWVGGAGPLQGVVDPVASIILTLLVSVLVLGNFAGRRWVSVNALAWFTATCAVFVYLGTPGGFSLPVELMMLFTAAAAALVLCRSTLPHVGEGAGASGVVFAGGAIMLCLASRAAWIVAAGPFSSVIDPVSAVALTWLVFAVAFTALTDRKAVGEHVLACLAGIGAALIHLSRVDLLAVDYALNLTFLLSAVGTAWYVGRRSIELAHSEASRQGAIAVVGALMGFAAAGALHVSLVQRLGMAVAPAGIMALAAASFGSSAYLAFRRWPSLAFLAGGFAVLSFAIYMAPIFVASDKVVSLSARISEPLGGCALPLAIAVLGAVTLAGILSSRQETLKPVAVTLAMGLNWPMFVQIGLLLVAGTYDPAHWNWVISGFWVAYGVVLITLGFVRDQRILRFGSFGIFGMTMVKIFTWDLAQSIDPVLRVVILLGLGLAMLGGGYAYIRTRAGKDEAAEAGA